IEGKQKTITLKEGNESSPKNNVELGIWTSRGVSLQMGKQDDNNSEITSANIKVTFYPEGGSSGGKITFTFHEQSAGIEVNPLTGKIKSDIFLDKEKK
ncbi:MAG: hypothetical protein KAG43_10065, partial [Candidatus Marithrix sp.]|nr:hypothetical protein [Candidatus Marithrix sp.]